MYYFLDKNWTKNTGWFMVKFFWALFLASAFVPFITYDTGIRCITAPCEGAVAKGGLIEFLLKSHNFSAYLVDPALFFVAFLIIYFIIAVIIHSTK